METTLLKKSFTKKDKRLGGMFTESKLLRQVGDINVAGNPRNTFYAGRYTPNAASSNLSAFDESRKNRMLEKYFGSAKEREYCLMTHTKNPNEAKFLKTCSSISKSLKDLHQLSKRSWTGTVHGIDSLAHVSLNKQEKVLEGSPPIIASTISAPKSVRVYSPEKTKYILQSARIENMAQQYLYQSMRGQRNTETAKGTKPFEVLLSNKPVKSYNGSIETFKTSWVDIPRVQSTSNYESARFNIINHGHGQNGNIAKMLQDNPKACNRIKSIAEYSDLTSTTAIKPNKLHQDAIVKCPNLFLKPSPLCAKQADAGKTYGPFFKLFK